MKCTKVNCPMQAGTPTDNCGENCSWRTIAKTGDLISRAAFLNDLSYCAPELFFDKDYLVAKIMKQPVVDAVEVVRCRDCRFYHGVNEECGCNGGYHSKGWYCADGEWRDDDGKLSDFEGRGDC